MQSHVIHQYRKHLILDHGWDADRANAVPDVSAAHDAEHASADLDHSHS